MAVLKKESGEVLATRLEIAATTLQRTKGLVGSYSLPAGSGLAIERAKQVHTLFMRYAIDIVFADRDMRVLHVVHGMPPWRVTRWVARARWATELPSGAARDLQPGQRMILE